MTRCNLWLRPLCACGFMRAEMTSWAGETYHTLNSNGYAENTWPAALPAPVHAHCLLTAPVSKMQFLYLSADRLFQWHTYTQTGTTFSIRCRTLQCNYRSVSVIINTSVNACRISDFRISFIGLRWRGIGNILCVCRGLCGFYRSHPILKAHSLTNTDFWTV